MCTYMCTRVFVHIRTHIYVDVTQLLKLGLLYFMVKPTVEHVYGYFVIFNDFLTDDR